MALSDERRCDVCGCATFINSEGDICCPNCGIIELSGKTIKKEREEFPKYVG